MNRKLLVAVVSGALALPLAASVQADATVYGNLRFGVQTDNEDNTDRVWDLGANKASRFGIKGSMEAGEGLTAGFHLERGIGDTLSKRLHNVYLSGGFGTLTFGQQNGPYYGATSWDNSQALGGLTDGLSIKASSRASGVSYASNLGGPFSFSVLAGSSANGAEKEGDGVNNVQISGSLAAGPVNLSVGYFQNDDADERIGGTASGTFAAIDWEIGYDSGTDVGGVDGTDDDRYGFHVGYSVGDGIIYTQFSDLDSDNNADDTDGWVFGYSHVLADNVVVYAEYSTSDDNDNVTSTSSVFAVKVGF